MVDSNQPTQAMVIETDLAGRQLGNYRLLRRLGRGAMAEVYLAEQCSLKRQVAIKVLRSTLASDETYVRRFHNEAQAAASLVHANIVQIHEVGCIDGVHFIAQEYVQGLNLNELLTRRGMPDVTQAVDIMRQVAAALQKASEQGIVHRDIKPENIMLASSGEVKVADFGLARLANDDVAANLTQAGFTMGTPLYMSPEQVEGRPLDPRSDIYSFGVTCYHMLAGEAPFRGDTALGVAVQHLKSQAPRLENLRPDLPAGLCRIVHKMLAKDRDDRYENARALLKDLRALPIDGQADEHYALDNLGDGGPEVASGSHREATQRLAALMRTTPTPVASRRPYILVAAGIVAMFGAGLLLARSTREQPLLAAGATNVKVERLASADAQYLHALMSGTEQDWKSVGEYFPQNHYLVRRANQQLARLYWQQRDYDAAKRLFDEFAAMDDTETQFRAFGLGGQALVLVGQGHKQQAADKLAELWPLRQYLDPQMENMLTQLVGGNRVGGSSGRPAEQWEQWIKNSGRHKKPPAGEGLDKSRKPPAAKRPPPAA